MEDDKKEIPGGTFLTDEDNRIIERTLEDIAALKVIRMFMERTGMSHREVVEHARKIVFHHSRKQ